MISKKISVQMQFKKSYNLQIKKATFWHDWMPNSFLKNQNFCASVRV